MVRLIIIWTFYNNYDIIRVERKTAEYWVINSTVQRRARVWKKSTNGDYCLNIKPTSYRQTNNLVSLQEVKFALVFWTKRIRINILISHRSCFWLYATFCSPLYLETNRNNKLWHTLFGEVKMENTPLYEREQRTHENKNKDYSYTYDKVHSIPIHNYV